MLLSSAALTNADNEKNKKTNKTHQHMNFKKAKVALLSSPNIRLALEERLIRKSTNMEKGTQNAGHFNSTAIHINPFGNPPLVIHKRLGTEGKPHQVQQSPQRILKIPQSRHIHHAPSQLLIQPLQNQVQAVKVRVPEKLLQKPRRTLGPSTAAPEHAPAAHLRKNQRQQRRIAVGVRQIPARKELGIGQMNPAVVDTELLGLPHHRLHLRAQVLVFHVGNFLALFMRAVVASDEVLERGLPGFSGGRRKVPGETVDQNPLHCIAREAKVLPFAENLRSS